MTVSYEPLIVPPAVLAMGSLQCPSCKVTVETAKLAMPNRCHEDCPLFALIKDSNPGRTS